MDTGASWHLWGRAGKSGLACCAIASGLLLAAPGHAQEMRDTGNAVASPGITSLPSSIPVKREQPGEASGGTGDRWWIAILAAGGLLAVTLVVARRKSASAGKAGRASWMRFGGLLDTVPSHEIERVSSTRLSPHHSLHVVVWGGRRLLLGCTDQSIQLLAEFSASAEGAEPGPGAGSSMEARR